jgi:hypothetical protein
MVSGETMGRRAFVGYSTPLAYDYRNKASKAPSDSDDSDSPNPILDSPFGLMILFDEIVFACRSLCPENLRNASFVRFLDEEGLAPDLSDIDYEKLETAAERLEKLGKQALHAQPQKKVISRITTLRQSGIYWSGVDNHSREITVGGFAKMGNQTLENVALDGLILERLGDDSLELVSNSLLQQFVDIDSSPLGQVKLAELLTINNIHSYQSPLGPYHPVIEEVRADPYISDFRKWLSQQKNSIDAQELKDAKEAVEASLQKAQDELFLKYLDPKGYALNIGKSALLEGLGLLMPGIGLGASVLEEGLRYNEARKIRWQGFLVSLRGKIPPRK